MKRLMDRCPDCGASVAGGREGCQALWDEVAAKAYGDFQYPGVHDLAFDTYCLQHPETYCRSAKSYAAHLTRLCCGLEYDGNRETYAAIQQWLNGAVSIEKPERLLALGQLTIAEVRAARTGEDHQKLVQVWAGNVWEAYAGQQDIARTWIRAALENSLPKLSIPGHRLRRYGRRVE